MELVITPVPLGNLTLSAKNVRKVDPGPDAHAELCALVSAAGLIYPLCVEPHPTNDEHYEVVAGGRRLAALNALATAGTLDPDYGVPCRLLPPGIDPEELSIMENSHEPMHTADQVTAFNKLAADGMPIPTIAQRFGVSERTVDKRLRLANIAPAVLDAYRAGEMNLGTLEAFAVSVDQERQAAVWEAIKNRYSPYGSHARSVRHLLTEDRIASTDPRARYATKRAYLKAGGRITEDLFANDKDTAIWYDDPEIVRQVATARLEKAAEKIGAGYSWIETHLDNPGYSHIQCFGTVKPQPTSEERARLDELTARIEAIYDSEDELTDKAQDELTSLRKEHTRLHDDISNRPLSEEAIKRSGVIVTLDHNARVTEYTGLVRPEDVPATTDPDNPETIESPRVTRRARDAKYYSDSHADMLRTVRGTEVQAKLAHSFETSFDVFTFQFANQIIRDSVYLYSAKALSFTAQSVHVDHGLANDPAAIEATRDQRGALESARDALNLSWAEHDDPALGYRAFCDLNTTEKHAIFSYCTAKTAQFQLSFDSERSKPLEVVIEQIHTTPHTSFRPGAEVFWKRLRKGQILDLADAVIGPTWTDQHRKAKKSDLIVVMGRVFQDPASDPHVPAQAHDRIRAWTIPGFPAHGPDPLVSQPNDTGANPVTDTDHSPETEEPRTATTPTPAEALPEFLND